MPLEHVTVQEMHTGTNGRLIIHIQDAHANLSGQQSLSKALDQILTKYDLKLVLVEGSARDSSLDEIRKLAPLKEWKIIARRFLYEGIISGEEYLNLTSEHPMKIIGIEYRDLYDEAVKAYAAIVDRRKDILHYLYQAKVSLDRLKVRMYPQELKNYEARKGPDDGPGSIDFKTGFTELVKLADAARYPLTDLPQIEKLRALMAKESLVDFDKAGKEQEAILKGLTAAGASEEVREFTEASRRLRFSQVSQFLLIQKLLQTASDREVSMENFPDLMAYAGYLEKFSDLKMDELMAQLEFLEDKVYEKLLPDDDARKVRAIDRFLGLLGNAYKLQMSSQEFGMFTFNEKDFQTESWLAFMNRQLVDLGFFESLVPYQPYLEEARADFGRFYQLVGERDIAFVENANRIMSEKGEKAAVLIAGGYHTSHLTELLRKEGTSYIVLTPVVTDSTDHERYEELLLSHLKDQEKRLASSGAGKKDSGPYRAQNVATTKIPRGIRALDAQTGARLGNLSPELKAFVDSRSKESGARLSDRITEASQMHVKTHPEALAYALSAGRDVEQRTADLGSRPLLVSGAKLPQGRANGDGLEAFMPEVLRQWAREGKEQLPVATADGARLAMISPADRVSQAAAESSQEEAAVQVIAPRLGNFFQTLSGLLASKGLISSTRPVTAVHVVLSDGLEGIRDDQSAQLISEIGKSVDLRVVGEAGGQLGGTEVLSVARLAQQITDSDSNVIFNLIGSAEEIQRIHEQLAAVSPTLLARVVRAPVRADKAAPVIDLTGAVMIGAMLAPVKDSFNVSEAGETDLTAALAQARDLSMALNPRIRSALAGKSMALLFSNQERPELADYLDLLRQASLSPFRTLRELVDQVAVAVRMASIAA